jgi:membrane protein
VRVYGEGVLKAAAQLITDAALAWFNDQVPRLGAALAFYTMLSLAPLFIVAVAVTGIWVSREQVQREVLIQIRDLIGPSGEEVISIIFNNAFDAYQQQSGVLASLVGGALLLFAASIVLHELKLTLNLIWEVQPGEDASLLQTAWGRVVSLAMLLGIGFLLLASLLLSTALGAFSRFLTEQLTLPLPLLAVLDTVVNLLLLTMLFALLYKVLPDVKVQWREVLLGAAVAAVMFTIGKWLIGLYLGNTAIGSAYGAASSLVIFLLWVYYTAQIFFFGAEVSKVYAKNRRPLHQH